jgi:hypothetical protein
MDMHYIFFANQRCYNIILRICAYNLVQFVIYINKIVFIIACMIL